MNSDYIKLPKGPERDREIGTIAINIRTLAQIKILTYHWELIPFRRNAKMPGRGGVTYDCFKLEDNWKSLPSGEAGRVTQDEYWDRISYFLEKVIPSPKTTACSWPVIPPARLVFPQVIRVSTSGTHRRSSMLLSATSQLSILLTMVSSWTSELPPRACEIRQPRYFRLLSISPDGARFGKYV